VDVAAAIADIKASGVASAQSVPTFCSGNDADCGVATDGVARYCCTIDRAKMGLCAVDSTGTPLVETPTCRRTVVSGIKPTEHTYVAVTAGLCCEPVEMVLYMAHTGHGSCPCVDLLGHRIRMLYNPPPFQGGAGHPELDIHAHRRPCAAFCNSPTFNQLTCCCSCLQGIGAACDDNKMCRVGECKERVIAGDTMTGWKVCLPGGSGTSCDTDGDCQS
jgi:hypothetical protein